MSDAPIPKPDEIIQDPSVFKFLLDTNVLLAFFNEKNPFHLECKTAIEALNHKTQVQLVVSYISLGEFLANRHLLGAKYKSVKNAIKLFESFGKKFTRTLSGGPALNASFVASLYAKHSRHHKFSRAGFADFLLLSQVDLMKNGHVLTCDKDMYLCGKSIFKNKIYYLPNKSDIKSDFVRLMSEIQNDFK